MIEDFVSFEIAKKLKEKGFDYPCIAHYDINEELKVVLREPIFWHSDVLSYTDAPTISQVLKWLRKEKNIFCLPFFDPGVDMWSYTIYKPKSGSGFPEFMSESEYDTYEQAALIGIEYVLNNLI